MIVEENEMKEKYIKPRLIGVYKRDFVLEPGNKLPVCLQLRNAWCLPPPLFQSIR